MATKLQDGNTPCLAATPSEPRPTVLVFDSGVGGLSVYDEIRQEMPNLIIDRKPTDAGIKHQHGRARIRRCSCQTRCIPVLQFGSHKLSRNLYRTGWLFYHEL